MLKLGGEETITVTYEDLFGEKHVVRARFRHPTTSERVEYESAQAQLAVSTATAKGGDEDGVRIDASMVQQLVQAQITLGSKLLVDVESEFDRPDGMSKVDAVREFAPDILAAIGQAAISHSKVVESHLGKSERPSEPS